MTDLLITVKLMLNQAKQQMTQFKKSVSSVAAGSKEVFPDLAQNSKDFQNIQSQAKRLLDIQKSLGTQNNIYRTQSKLVNNLGKELDLTTKQIKNLTKAQKGFNFDFLTFIFTGMLLERVFGGALKSILNSYKEIAGVNSAFNRSVLKLSASWSFLKFSIADALNNPAVVNGVEFIIDSFEVLADFISENEKLSLSLLGILATGFVIGKFVSLIGGFLQLGILIESSRVRAERLGTELGLLKKLGVISVVLGVGFILTKSVTDFINSSESGKEAWESFMDSIGLLGKQTLNALSELFFLNGIEITTWTELFVRSGAAAVTIIAGLISVISGLVLIFEIVWNSIQAVTILVGGAFLGALTLVIDAIVAIKELLTGEDFSGFKSTSKVISLAAKEIENQIDDTAGAWSDFAAVQIAVGTAIGSVDKGLRLLNSDVSQAEKDAKKLEKSLIGLVNLNKEDLNAKQESIILNSATIDQAQLLLDIYKKQNSELESTPSGASFLIDDSVVSASNSIDTMNQSLKDNNSLTDENSSFIANQIAEYEALGEVVESVTNKFVDFNAANADLNSIGVPNKITSFSTTVQ